MVGQPFDTKELAEAYLNADELTAMMFEVQEINYNDTPPDEHTEVLKARLYELFETKEIANIHMSKGPKFFEMSINERYQFMIDLIDDVNGFPREKLDFEDRSDPRVLD